MQMKHDADIKKRLLEDSDATASDLSDTEDNSSFGAKSDYGVSSDEDEPEATAEEVKKSEVKVKPEKPKVSNPSQPEDLSEIAELPEISAEVAEIEDMTPDENVIQIKKSSPTKGSPVKSTKVEDGSETDDLSDDEPKAKKQREQRDPFERQIFSKNFLEENGVKNGAGSKSTNKPSTSGTSGTTSNSKSPTKASNGEPTVIADTIDLSMFENRRAEKKLDLDKMFKNRANNLDAPGPSGIQQITPKPAPTPTPVVNDDDDLIILSSDSDSEISAQPTGANARLPKRKKMLTEEELQEETKRAQKEENQRVERLKKKDEALTQMMSERMSQEDPQNELILDYDPKKNITISIHPQLVKKLKDHQRDGIKFMYDTCYGSISDEVKTESGCILAHCMGLGKTLQLIALLHTLICNPELNTKKVIVICPKSTIMNWFEEFQKWIGSLDSKGLKIYFLAEQPFLERLKILDDWHRSPRPGVFLINYEAFRYMVHFKGNRGTNPMGEAEVERLKGIINKCLLDPGPDLVVCDEGHLIKNQNNATNRAITKIATRRRIVLTGTPVQNNLNEYYAMVDWIKPALLGTVKEFNNLYANPIKDGQHMDSTPQMIKRMKQRSFILNRKLSKFVQRREAMVLREFLPDKHEYCIFVPLTPIQEELYETFLSKFCCRRFLCFN